VAIEGALRHAFDLASGIASTGDVFSACNNDARQRCGDKGPAQECRSGEYGILRSWNGRIDWLSWGRLSGAIDNVLVLYITKNLACKEIQRTFAAHRSRALESSNRRRLNISELDISMQSDAKPWRIP
jgi:hypothetical protein